MTARLAAALLLSLRLSYGDAGVLIASNGTKPDPAALSLEEMAVDIVIDNGDARVRVRQIFASRRDTVLEGNYTFALSSRATVSDFAVWDDVTRIPGVILERRRAEEVYTDLKWQAIDPGLLQMGERDFDEARQSPVFTARIVPIPARGTKRLEIEYHESISAEDLKSVFALPLRPDAFRAQTAARLSIAFELRSQHALSGFEVTSKTYPLQIKEQTATLIRGSYQGSNVTLGEDFTVRYGLESSGGRKLEVLAYRERQEEMGFFQASALLAELKQPAASAEPRTVIALFDNSLSMQWEKLERSFRALESLLNALRPTDHFNLLLFNTEVTPFAPKPVTADAASVAKALDLVRSSYLRGGTNLQTALDAAVAQSEGRECYLVLLGDGGATRGIIQNGKLAERFETKLKQVPEARRPRPYIFAVGDDANLPLLKMLARSNGVLEWVRSTEPAEFKLNAFLSKIGRSPIENLRLTATPTPNFDLIYPLEDRWFAGSLASWVGQYKRPVSATFTARGVENGRGVTLRATASLPAHNVEHPDLPRTWAKARVDALLEKIEREGEDASTIDEIIRLARKYKFVTPYTSFLAAPRALLRPRVIRPGDPVLRVRADESIVSVVALFPFGPIQKLRFLPSESIWQTRFLAPTDMTDGTYKVRLVLRDRAGHVYRESKSFVIASKPPLVRVKLDRERVRRGEAVRLCVSASESARSVVARMYGVAPVYLRWNSQAGSNTGEFFVPAHLPAGRYRVTVTAEDIAHNIGSQEVSLEVAP